MGLSERQKYSVFFHNYIEYTKLAFERFKFICENENKWDCNKEEARVIFFERHIEFIWKDNDGWECEQSISLDDLLDPDWKEKYLNKWKEEQDRLAKRKQERLDLIKKQEYNTKLVATLQFLKDNPSVLEDINNGKLS